MPVHRIIAVIFKSLKMDPNEAKNYSLQTFGGVLLNDQAPLVVYGLGSLLQNWQLKLVPKPPVRKGTSAKGFAPPATGAAAGPSGAQAGEFPILVVFEGEKFTSKAQRVLLHSSTKIETVVSKLCESQKVKHASRFALQTLEGVMLQSNFTLESYGLGRRFNKWELKIVSKGAVDTAASQEAPEGVKYAWVLVDDTLTLVEAKDIIKKLDWALAKTTSSAKSSLAQLREQIQLMEKQNAKLAKRLERKKKSAETTEQELKQVQKELRKSNKGLKQAKEQLASSKQTQTFSLQLNGVAVAEDGGKKSARATADAEGKSPRPAAAAEKPVTPRQPTPTPSPRPTTAEVAAATVTTETTEKKAEDQTASAGTAASASTDSPAEITAVAEADKQASAASESANGTADAETPESATATGKDSLSEESANKPNENGDSHQATSADADKSAEPDTGGFPKTEEDDASDKKKDDDASDSSDDEKETDKKSKKDADDDDDDDDDDLLVTGKGADLAAAALNSIDMIEIEQKIAAKHAEEMSKMQRQYEAEIATLRQELDELRSSSNKLAPPPRTPRGGADDDKSGSEKSEKDRKSGAEDVPFAPPAPAPAPPPPPPKLDAPEKPAKKERPKKRDRDESTSSGAVGVSKAASGGIGAGVLDAISNKKFALKKVDNPGTLRKKKYGNDFLQQALEKRFVSMNLDDVEELDSWDDDSSSTKWSDASAWGDDVLHI